MLNEDIFGYEERIDSELRGDRVLVQVWDTGIGIAPGEQSRVFDEFYQVGGTHAPIAPTDRKGLGLGLSIVKRLSTLIGAPLSLRSQPGRGSCFELWVPMAPAN